MGGAKGVIVNRPDKVMTFEELFELLGVRFKDTEGELLVWNGGPVHADKFGILHTPDVTTRKSKDAGAGLKATDESMNMVSKMAKGAGPEKAKLFWGMSGWGPKKLEGEVARGDWYVIKPDHDLIFADDPATVYDTAMEHYVREQEEKEKQQAAGQ